MVISRIKETELSFFLRVVNLFWNDVINMFRKEDPPSLCMYVFNKYVEWISHRRHRQLFNLSACPPVHPSPCPPVRQSARPPVCLSACPPVRLSVCPPVRLSACLRRSWVVEAARNTFHVIITSCVRHDIYYTSSSTSSVWINAQCLRQNIKLHTY